MRPAPEELAAREVHRLGKRADRPIVTVNCAAIPDTLIESELFGYEKGAFTGATSNRSGLIEAADGGTLFLDEIGELPLAAQARLLRYIQEGEIRRIGSVTSKKSMRDSSAQHTETSACSRIAASFGRICFTESMSYVSIYRHCESVVLTLSTWPNG